jgi:hypothetical protein
MSSQFVVLISVTIKANTLLFDYQNSESARLLMNNRRTWRLRCVGEAERLEQNRKTPQHAIILPRAAAARDHLFYSRTHTGDNKAGANTHFTIAALIS